MRRAALTIIATVVASHVLADEVPCAGIGQIAESVMKRRQNGLSLQSTLEAARQVKTGDAGSTLDDMIITAYEVPLYSTSEMKQQAIGIFRDEQQLICIKIIKAAKPPA